MKDDDASAGKTEVVIVRRRGGDDAAGGKGGAWKIAYADFVTAMMAFFLVMWLINASNEKTRAQVASYFNPIKLTDTTTGARSLKDMKDTRNTEDSDEGGSAEGTPPSTQDIRSEAEMLANPPESLDRIAKTVADAEFRNAGLENPVEIAPAVKPDPSNPGVGDPFDPRAWEAVKDAAPAAGEVPETKAGEPDADKTEASARPAEGVAGDAAKATGKKAEAPGDEAAQENRMKTEAAAISEEIASLLGQDREKLQGSFEVVSTKSGLLISLTEQENFEMFETGSAEPRPEALKLVEAVAAAVGKRDGVLVVRGHTDSRPYRNRYYDNWQLSTARAHFARYMLVRGGLDENRIRKIEGVADREPRNTQDPQAAENRRIEILIGSEAP